MEHLKEYISENAIVSYEDLENKEISQNQLKKLLSSGHLSRALLGTYIGKKVDQTRRDIQYKIALKRCGQPSSICLVSALDYYNLIDEIPNKIWIMVNDSKRITEKSIKLWRTRNPNWDIGILEENGVRISSIERTLVDCIAQRRILGNIIGIEALKNAITEKKTTLKKVYDMSKLLGEEKKLMPILTVLQA